MYYDSKKAAAHIRALRNSKGWSQSQMAEELDARIGQNSAAPEKQWLELKNENGKQAVSQLERAARQVTKELAFVYADIFNVSLDYVLGRSESYTETYEDITKETGLSNSALDNLQLIRSSSFVGVFNQKMNGMNIDMPLYKDIVNEIIANDATSPLNTGNRQSGLLHVAKVMQSAIVSDLLDKEPKLDSDDRFDLSFDFNVRPAQNEITEFRLQKAKDDMALVLDQVFAKLVAEYKKKGDVDNGKKEEKQ